MEAPKIGDQTPYQLLHEKDQSLRLSVSEKIFKAQYEAPAQKAGPELELFFHELTNKETSPQHLFNYSFSICFFPVLLILYPLVAIAIKLSSAGPVINKIKTEGKSGRVFSRYEFRTTHLLPNKPVSFNQRTSFTVGNFLYASGLYKLPAIINVFKKEMSAIGPMAYNQKESVFWNNKMDDFYKRFAVKPGVIPIYPLNKEERTLDKMSTQLKKEFKYIVAPSLKYDIKILFGYF